MVTLSMHDAMRRIMLSVLQSNEKDIASSLREGVSSHRLNYETFKTVSLDALLATEEQLATLNKVDTKETFRRRYVLHVGVDDEGKIVLAASQRNDEPERARKRSRHSTVASQTTEPVSAFHLVSSFGERLVDGLFREARLDGCVSLEIRLARSLPAALSSLRSVCGTYKEAFVTSCRSTQSGEVSKPCLGILLLTSAEEADRIVAKDTESESATWTRPGLRQKLRKWTWAQGPWRTQAHLSGACAVSSADGTT